MEEQSVQAIQLATEIEERGPVSSCQGLLHSLQSSGAYVSLEEVEEAYRVEEIKEDSELSIALLVRLLQRILQHSMDKARHPERQTITREREEGDVSAALRDLADKSTGASPPDEPEEEGGHAGEGARMTAEDANLRSMLRSFDLKYEGAERGGQMTVEELTGILHSEQEGRLGGTPGHTGHVKHSLAFDFSSQSKLTGQPKPRRPKLAKPEEGEVREPVATNQHIRGRMKHIHQDTTIYKTKTETTTILAKRRASLAIESMQMLRVDNSTHHQKDLHQLPYKKRLQVAAIRLTRFFRSVIAKRVTQKQRAHRDRYTVGPGPEPESGTHGRLKVHFRDGMDLLPMDGTGAGRYWSDPYARIALGRFYYRETQCKQKTINPHWGEDFELWVPMDTEQKVRIEVFDRDYGEEDELIGWGVVPLKELERDTPTPVTLLLHRRLKGGKARHPTRKNAVRMVLEAVGWGRDAKGKGPHTDPLIISGGEILEDVSSDPAFGLASSTNLTGSGVQPPLTKNAQSRPAPSTHPTSKAPPGQPRARRLPPMPTEHQASFSHASLPEMSGLNSGWSVAIPYPQSRSLPPPSLFQAGGGGGFTMQKGHSSFNISSFSSTPTHELHSPSMMMSRPLPLSGQPPLPQRAKGSKKKADPLLEIIKLQNMEPVHQNISRHRPPKRMI